jgi:hypothetical protein
MNDGGYSRLEKDFLGNERMVHYDASGNMLGASDVIREPDGTIRISNDQSPLTPESDSPPVEVVVPVSAASPQEPGIGIREREASLTSRMPMNQVVMYSIAAFIATSLLTLGVLSFLKSNRNDASVRTSIQPPPISRPESSPNSDLPLPDPVQERDDRPSDPRPRNDEQPNEPRPFDETAPDSNMDDSRPRIQNNDPSAPTNNDTKPEPKPRKGNNDDPIDLRGDEGTKTDPPKKGDPGDDPLRGDDIH